MKLKLKPKRNNRSYRVKVTDEEGRIQVFSSLTEAAEAMQCSKQHIYMSIKHGYYARGCKVERLD